MIDHFTNTGFKHLNTGRETWWL